MIYLVDMHELSLLCACDHLSVVSSHLLFVTLEFVAGMRVYEATSTAFLTVVPSGFHTSTAFITVFVGGPILSSTSCTFGAVLVGRRHPYVTYGTVLVT